MLVKGPQEQYADEMSNINLPKFDIVDVRLDLSYTSYKGMDKKIISQSGLSPLFKVKGIRTSIFLPPAFADKSLKAFDFVTPLPPAGEYKDNLYFDYVSSDDWD